MGTANNCVFKAGFKVSLEMSREFQWTKEIPGFHDLVLKADKKSPWYKDGTPYEIPHDALEEPVGMPTWLVGGGLGSTLWIDIYPYVELNAHQLIAFQRHVEKIVSGIASEGLPGLEQVKGCAYFRHRPFVVVLASLEQAALLNMSVQDFFSKKNIHQAGLDSAQFQARLFSFCKRHRVTTVEDLISCAENLGRVGMGPGLQKKIDQVLRHKGLSLEVCDSK